MRFKYSSRHYVSVCALCLTVLATGCSTSNGEYSDTTFTASTTRNASPQDVGVYGNQARKSDSWTIEAATPSRGDVTQAGGSRAGATTPSAAPNYSGPRSDIYSNDARYTDSQGDNLNIINPTEVIPAPQYSEDTIISSQLENGHSAVQQEDSGEAESMAIPRQDFAVAAKPGRAIAENRNDVAQQFSGASLSPSSRVAPASIGFRWPVRGRIIKGFGKQSNGESNNGIYLAAPAGTPVLAASAGTVIYAGSDIGEFGNLILVQHDNNWVSAYAHNDTINVIRGDGVKRGQNIATVGQTGNVSTPQLHFELRKNAKPVDPLPRMTDG